VAAFVKHFVAESIEIVCLALATNEAGQKWKFLAIEAMAFDKADCLAVVTTVTNLQIDYSFSI